MHTHTCTPHILTPARPPAHPHTHTFLDAQGWGGAAWLSAEKPEKGPSLRPCQYLTGPWHHTQDTDPFTCHLVVRDHCEDLVLLLVRTVILVPTRHKCFCNRNNFIFGSETVTCIFYETSHMCIWGSFNWFDKLIQSEHLEIWINKLTEEIPGSTHYPVPEWKPF